MNFYSNSVHLDFDFELEDKVKVKGTLTERWIQILSRSIACGDKQKRTVERKVGISKTQREDLESLVKGNIGLKGIISLESQIKSKTNIEISLDYAITETEEKEIEAPRCGRKTLIVYQLIREYDISFIEKRFFGLSKRPTQITITEYTNHFYDNSFTIENDPDCGCPIHYENPDNGLFALLINNIYQLISSYKIIEDKIKIKNLNIEISNEDLGKMILGNFKIEKTSIPEYIRHLAKIDNDLVPLSLNTNGNIIYADDEKMFLTTAFSRYSNIAPLKDIPGQYSGYGFKPIIPGFVIISPPDIYRRDKPFEQEDQGTEGGL